MKIHLRIQGSRACKSAGFTIVELLVVIAIISVLAATLMPVFFAARGKARQTVCSSNLRQLGLGISMYVQDCDGHFPYAIDPADRNTPQIWVSDPQFQAAIPSLGMLHEVLQPYVKSRQILCCPADSGFKISEFTGEILDATPTSFVKFGTSYYYRTQLAETQATESTIGRASEVNVMFDGAGHWHGTLYPLVQRYNVLYADGHVKNVQYGQLHEVWSSSLN